MSRFYVPPDAVKDGKIYAGKEESHHIIDVMRLCKGDSVTVFDGTGREYNGTIVLAESKRAVINILNIKDVNKKRSAGISLAQAIPKKDKMDLIIRKATELGIEEIIPVESARTVVRPRGGRMQHKIERWHKNVIEASKQCGRTELPKVSGILSFDAMLDLMPNYNLAIMPCLSDRARPLNSALKKIGRPEKVLAIIGPEGDFTEDEIIEAEKKGAILVSLGNLVLQSDTAAIATISILNYKYAT